VAWEGSCRGQCASYSLAAPPLFVALGGGWAPFPGRSHGWMTEGLQGPPTDLGQSTLLCAEQPQKRTARAVQQMCRCAMQRVLAGVLEVGQEVGK
jgi:hypothetical protein